MDIDRQAIERRDFPIGRRGYEPAAVDAHLRALANEIEELQRARTGAGAESSLASTAGNQVQSILAAAETAAADIEREALLSATTMRDDANRDAERTREEAIKQARAHVAAVAQATAVLLERVSSMDAEAGALVESLRAGAGRLAGDLAAADTNMGELYDAASGRASSIAGEQPLPAGHGAAKGGVDRSSAANTPTPSAPGAPTPLEASAPALSPQPPESSRAASPQPRSSKPTSSRPASSQPTSPRPAPAASSAAAPAVENGDLDGARLIALNMALNGESRADTDRYLAENFALTDRQKLIEEVYAAIEG